MAYMDISYIIFRIRIAKAEKEPLRPPSSAPNHPRWPRPSVPHPHGSRLPPGTLTPCSGRKIVPNIQPLWAGAIQSKPAAHRGDVSSTHSTTFVPVSRKGKSTTPLLTSYTPEALRQLIAALSRSHSRPPALPPRSPDHVGEDAELHGAVDQPDFAAADQHDAGGVVLEEEATHSPAARSHGGGRGGRAEEQQHRPPAQTRREPGFPSSAPPVPLLVAERSGAAPAQCPPRRCPLPGWGGGAGNRGKTSPKERSGAGMGCAGSWGERGSPSPGVLRNRGSVALRDAGGGHGGGWAWWAYLGDLCCLFQLVIL